MRPLLVLAAALLLVSCGGDDDVAAPTTVAATTPAPSCAADPIGCHMTKDSGVFGVPYPDDAVAEGDPAFGFLASNVGTVTDVGAWYQVHLVAAGWTFDEEDSIVNPGTADSAGLGYVSSAFYCKANPEQWVSIIIGLKDEPTTGRPTADAPGTIKLVVSKADESGCLVIQAQKRK